VSGVTLADSTFAVPAANGCGLLGVLDLAVDLKEGLPSAAGDNSVVMNNMTFNVAGFSTPASHAPDEGQDLAAAWTSAVSG
jgi:hypothetical protein